MSGTTDGPGPRPEERTPAPPPGGPAAPGTPSKEDRAHLARVQRARRAAATKAVVIVTIVVLLLVFVIQNSQGVEVDFVFVTRRPALIWVMVACILLGGVVGYLIGRPSKAMRFHEDGKARGDEKRKKR